jgi:hypothetical protein
LGNTRSIRRFVAVRPVAGEPTIPLHAAGARRRRDVVSHSAGSLPKRLFMAQPAVIREVAARLRAIADRIGGRRGTLIVVGATLLLLIVVAAVVAARIGEPRRVAPPRVGGAAQPPPGFAFRSDPAGAPQQGRATGQSPVGSPAHPATGGQPTTIAATYRTASTWTGGYRGEVTIRNVGDAGVNGWTGTITLPLSGLTVVSAQGAAYRQSGRTVTLTPTADTGSVPPHGAVRFDFTINGDGPPAGCAIDGRPCDGFSG